MSTVTNLDRNILVALAGDNVAQGAFGLFILNNRSIDTALGTPANDDETPTMEQDPSVPPKTPPSHFVKCLLEVATRDGGRIVSREAFRAAVRKYKPEQEGAKAKDAEGADDDAAEDKGADDDADDSDEELFDEFDAQASGHDLSTTSTTIGDRMMESIITCVTHSDVFTERQLRLLKHRATTRHVESWVRAARSIFSQTNSSIGIAMSIALGKEEAAPDSGHFIQDSLSNWSLLEDLYRDLKAEKPTLGIIHNCVADLMAVTAPKTARAARANAVMAKNTAKTLRSILEHYSGMSAMNLATLLEATSIAQGSTDNGLQQFLLGYRKSPDLDPSEVGALADEARAFNVAQQAKMPEGSASKGDSKGGKKKPKAKRDKPKPISKKFQYINAMRDFFKSPPTPLTFQHISDAHRTVVASNSALASLPIPADLRAFVTDTSNFKEYFPLRHQDKTLALCQSA